MKSEVNVDSFDLNFSLCSLYTKCLIGDLLIIGLLLGWLSGKEAEYVEMLTDEEVGRRCVETLKAFLGKTKSVPNLKKVTRFSLNFYIYLLYFEHDICHVLIAVKVHLSIYFIQIWLH